MSQEHVDAVRLSLDGWNRDEFEDGMARRVRSYIDPDRARAAVGLPAAG